MGTEKKGQWWNSTIAKGIGGVLILLCSAFGAAFLGKSSGDKGGNLKPYIESHNREVALKEENYKLIISHFEDDMARMEAEMDDMWDELEECGGHNNSEAVNEVWRDEPHGDFLFKRNMQDRKLYYIASNFQRYQARFQDDIWQFKHGKDQGVEKWWKCRYDQNNPGVIFPNVAKEIYKWW